MSKIAIDSLPLVSGHASRGMGVYARNLIKNLGDNVDSFVFSDNKEKLKNYDILHYPYFDLFYHTLPFKKYAKTVVTVADVIPLIYPRHYPPGIKGKLNYYLQKYSLKGADAVITITETSKRDIAEYLNYPEKKIFVTLLAPNFKTKKLKISELLKIQKKYALPKEFVLYIGDVNWNKNLLNLVQAIKIVKTNLVIVGKSATNTDFNKDHIENKPLVDLQSMYGKDKDILRLGYVEDSELNAIWQLAKVSTMASYYEGFGLSVVEAMDAGVPVACSNTPALNEVAGEAALYYEPGDVNDIAGKISKLLKDGKLRMKYIKKGYEQVKKYSWKKTANETMAVYKKILNT